jgi:hypothetical protein
MKIVGVGGVGTSSATVRSWILPSCAAYVYM